MQQFCHQQLWLLDSYALSLFCGCDHGISKKVKGGLHSSSFNTQFGHAANRKPDAAISRGVRTEGLPGTHPGIIIIILSSHAIPHHSHAPAFLRRRLPSSVRYLSRERESWRRLTYHRHLQSHPESRVSRDHGRVTRREQRTLTSILNQSNSIIGSHYFSSFKIVLSHQDLRSIFLDKASWAANLSRLVTANSKTVCQLPTSTSSSSLNRINYTYKN